MYSHIRCSASFNFRLLFWALAAAYGKFPALPPNMTDWPIYF